MSVYGTCFDAGQYRKKDVKMDSFDIVQYEGTNRYMARGNSTKCSHALSRAVGKQFALDWEKSTGKKIKVVRPNAKKQKETAARKKRKADRKLKKKEAEKEKKRKERERAIKKKEASKKKKIFLSPKQVWLI